MEERYHLGREAEGQKTPSMKADKPREQYSKRLGLCLFDVVTFPLANKVVWISGVPCFTH